MDKLLILKNIELILYEEEQNMISNTNFNSYRYCWNIHTDNKLVEITDDISVLFQESDIC